MLQTFKPLSSLMVDTEGRVQGINPALSNLASGWLHGSSHCSQLVQTQQKTEGEHSWECGTLRNDPNPSSTDAKTLDDGKSGGSNGRAVLLLLSYWHRRFFRDTSGCAVTNKQSNGGSLGIAPPRLLTVSTLMPLSLEVKLPK